MTDPRRIPVIVGVGEVSGRGTALDIEPVELISRAARVALSDTGTDSPWIGLADSIAVCHIASWGYSQSSKTLTEMFDAAATDLVDAPIGGQWPTRLLDRAAERIASGQSTVAVVAGGEAQASVSAMMKSGRDPVADAGWSADPGGPPSFDLDQLGSAAMQQAGLITPVRIYPLFDNRLRYRSNESPTENTIRSSELYSEFSRVAAANPYAWNSRVRTAEDIRTLSPGNRMVCEPYPLAMNAMPFVDQAACIIVTSVAEARERGVPESKMVYVWGGAGADDTADILDRSSFDRSEAMESALARTLTAAEIGSDHIDVLDVYSCFPIVPTLATRHLGTPNSLIPSVTGGHSSFGGPLSSHSVHSITASVRAIRGGQHCALVHANGGFMTYQHSILLADRENHRGYVGNPEPVVVHSDPPARAKIAKGPITVETATVEYSRQQEPVQAFVIGRDEHGRRVAAQTSRGDSDSARRLSLHRTSPATEIIGTTVVVEPIEGYVRVEQ